MQNSEQKWSQELVDCIHFLHQKGYAPATSSNYSFKFPEEAQVHISTSGVDKGLFTTEHLMIVDLEGKAIEDNRKPSAETLLHTLIYKQAPEMTCVLHTHTVFNTTLSMLFAGQGHLRLEGYEVLKGLSGIRTHEAAVVLPIFPNSQDMPQLAADIHSYWQAHPEMKGFLLAGHGLYTWGQSIAETKRHIEVFEFLFECYYRIKTFQSVQKSLTNGYITHS